MENPLSTKPLFRHIFWRRQYDQARYARHLPQPDLNRRIRDIVLNLLVLDANAMINLGPLDAEKAVWMEKWTHVLEEMELRHGPYPNGFTRDILHREPFPNFASELAQKAARELASRGLEQEQVYIKYGKREFMERLLDVGSLRIQPASYYSQPSHNGAIGDDELSLDMSLVLSRDDVIKVVKNPQDVPEIINDQVVNVRHTSLNDYWIYCVTQSVGARLFADFEADSCVIVRNRDEFRNRLKSASEPRLQATMFAGPTKYFDPLLPQSAKVSVPFAKHFRYTYQQEYRYAWFPPTPGNQLSHADIEIGSLRDIAELVVL